MPNIKSAIKRVSIIKKKTDKNNMLKSEYKTAIKKFEVSVEENKKDEAGKLFIDAIKKIDGALSKGIIKKNTASRKKSKLAKKLNTLTKTAKTETKKAVEKVEKPVEAKAEEVVVEKPAKKVAAKKATTAKATTVKAKTATKPAAKKATATKTKKAE